MLDMNYSNNHQIIRDNGDGSFRHSSSFASATAVTLSQRTDALVRGLDLVLEHHGVEQAVRDALDLQFHAHLDTSDDEGVWLKRAKFALTYPLSKYLRNVLPPSPDVPFVPSGLLRVWMKPRFNAFNRKNTHLWYSWLQAKRSTLPASDDIVDATYEKHFATLTQYDTGDDTIIDGIMRDPTFLRLLNLIKRRITDDLKDRSPFETYSASNSASFEQTRGSGGQFFQLLSLGGLTERLASSELYSMKLSPVVYSRSGIHYNVISEIRCAYGELEWNSLTTHSNSLDLKSPIKCTIQAVLEPMKVRVISKGESLPYYTCRPLQKALHSSMRDLDCFRLIGRPFSPTDMMDLKESALPTDNWFSVDYSAATDGLSWKYSGKIFRHLIKDLPQRQQDLAISVLGPHALHYPTRGGREVVFKGVQQNGQLMGSILSFPILCLANLGVYLFTTQNTQRGWSDRKRLRHVLINGDDMVYAADPSLWDLHINIAGRVGLEMSIGKAYRHREYANINSTSIHFPLHKEKSLPWQIDYLNSGLYFGQHKVQSRVDSGPFEPVGDISCKLASTEQLAYLYGRAHLSQDPVNGLSSNLNVLLSGCLPGRQSSILSRFLVEHSEDLRKECSMVVRFRGRPHLTSRNLFLPISLGGMGVLPPPGWKYRVKPIQLQVAQSFVDQNTAPISAGSPLPAFGVEKLELVATVPWVKPTFDQDIRSCSASLVKMTRKTLRFLQSGILRYCPNSLGVLL